MSSGHSGAMHYICCKSNAVVNPPSKNQLVFRIIISHFIMFDHQKMVLMIAIMIIMIIIVTYSSASICPRIHFVKPNQTTLGAKVLAGGV